MVTRESEWDDNERDKMRALEEYEAGVCDCGYHRSIADEDPNVTLATRACPVCAASEVAMRMQGSVDAAADKRAKAKAGVASDAELPPEIPRAADGRKAYMRLVSDEEIESQQE